MALVTTPKAASANSNTPSRTVTRQDVTIARPTASSARVQALKDRLSATPPTQPIAPRKAGSSARAEEMAKLTKFQSPAQTQQARKAPAATSARAGVGNLEEIEPPPSGLAQGGEIIRPNTDAETVTPPAEATSDESVDPQFVSLARKESQLRKAQQDFKTEQTAWQQEKAKFISKDEFKSNPLKYLAEAGITSDKLVELQINQAAPDPQQDLISQIAELKAQLQGIIDPEQGVLAKRDQEQYTQVVEQIRNDAKLLVDSNPSFGTIKSEGQSEEVVKLITATFEDSGEVLDVEEACQLIEAKLQQRLESQYKKLQQYEWLKSKLGQGTENSPEATTAQQSQPAPKPKATTLTNNGASTRQLTPRERAIMLVQERIDAARGK